MPAEPVLVRVVVRVDHAGHDGEAPAVDDLAAVRGAAADRPARSGRPTTVMSARRNSPAPTSTRPFRENEDRPLAVAAETMSRRPSRTRCPSSRTYLAKPRTLRRFGTTLRATATRDDVEDAGDRPGLDRHRAPAVRLGRVDPAVRARSAVPVTPKKTAPSNATTAGTLTKPVSSQARHLGQRSRDPEQARQEEVVDGHDHRRAGNGDGEEAGNLEPAVQEVVVDEPRRDHAAAGDEQAGVPAAPVAPGADEVLAGVDRLVVVAVVDRELADRGQDPGEPERAEERVVRDELHLRAEVGAAAASWAIIQPPTTKSRNKKPAKRYDGSGHQKLGLP